MPGGNSTQQAESNQQGNQQQAESYYQGLVNQALGGLHSYLAAHPAPASRWRGIINPAKQTGTYGGGTAEGPARVGETGVPGGKPYDPRMTPLARQLIGTGPRGKP